MNDESALMGFGDYDDAAIMADIESAKEATKAFKKKLHTKFDVGDTMFRILPAPANSGRKSPFVRVFEHYIDVPGTGKGVGFVCPRLMANQACPGCVMSDRFKARGNKLDDDLAWKCSAKMGDYFAVIFRDHEADGVAPMKMGQKTIREHLERVRKIKRLNYSHPLTGCDFNVNRTGTDQDSTRYAVTDMLPSQLHTSVAQMNEWILAIPDLTQYARVRPLEDIQHMLRTGEYPKTVTQQAPQVMPGGRTVAHDALVTPRPALAATSARALVVVAPVDDPDV